MLISVIIPTLNAQQRLGDCLSAVRRVFKDDQVIVVDGGSQDRTLEIARAFKAQIVSTPKGRGIQCHAGAGLAPDHAVLLFLHADTILPDEAGQVLKDYFSRPGVQAATFRLAFDHDHWLLRVYAWMTRFDSILTRFGDQGIVVNKEFYQSIGGFPAWPLFEDVHFLRLARRKTRIYSLPARVTTSARRFLDNGVVRQQILNVVLIVRYLSGEAPQKFAASYQKFCRRGKP